VAADEAGSSSARIGRNASRAKRPLLEPLCPDEIDEASADCNSGSDGEAADGLASVYEDEYESGDSEKRGQRI
jgi:hypothetical protein